MEERTIDIEGFPFLTFTDFVVRQGANRHLEARISGVVESEWAREQQAGRLQGQHAVVWIDKGGGQKYKWLDSSIEKLRIAVSGGVFTISMELASHSQKSDRQKHTRTFQDAAYTYEDVVEILGQNSEDFNIMILAEEGEQPIGDLLVQYQETNWEFAKRLASRLHTYLYPCEYLERNGIYMGSTLFGASHIVDTAEYQVCKDMAEYYYSQTDRSLVYYEQSAVSYQITSAELYRLRDGVCLNGKDLYVFAMESRLNGSVLEHTYTLKEQHGFRTVQTDNRQLTGASLTGRVHKVQKDLVQLQIDGDIPQRRYRWFPYATVYSSADNTGWYFMPEIGDRVRLTFPTEKEADSYVASSVHLGERDDPDIKSIRTCYQKEIVFAPDSLHISNGAGSYITLDDHSGIVIHSEQGIRIESGQSISIAGAADVKLLGGSGVVLQQQENSIVVEDTIDISAGRLRLR